MMGDDGSTDEIDGFLIGENITWIVWDINTCQEYQVNASYISGPSSFTSNGLTFLESLSHNSCQNVSLPGGWFIYSSYIETENMDVEIMMSQIVDNLIMIKNNDGAVYLPEWNFNGIGDIDFIMVIKLKQILTTFWNYVVYKKFQKKIL